MLALDASGAAAYADWLEGEAASMLKYVQAVYRSWAIQIHAEITELTPQWTGNLAANWWLSANGTPGEEQDLGDPSVRRPGEGGPAFSPYSRGMEPAVSFSLARAAQLALPALNDVLYIYNPVSYAQEAEDDTLEPRIRPINRLPRAETGRVAMVAYAYAKYSQKASPLS
jgi:hypothetical protein